jgi:hypothetical protein
LLLHVSVPERFVEWWEEVSIIPHARMEYGSNPCVEGCVIAIAGLQEFIAMLLLPTES